MPTSFASLVADVMTLTNRPDLVNETNLAVKAATLKAHHKDDFIKDFFEASITWTTADYFQTLDYKSVIPLWRKPRYIRKYASTPGVFFKLVEPEKVVDGYGTDRTDIYYVAGANINIRSSTQFQYALVGCYVNPIVTSNGFSSWIADDHPFAIVYEAAAIIFKSIGFDEQVITYRDMVKDEYQGLIQHAIT
jgi:hypothetical protein